MATYTDLNIEFGYNRKQIVLEDVAAINQSIGRILVTPVMPANSDYRRPTYGSYVPYLLQRPKDENTRISLINYAITAIRRWEPRANLIEEQVDFEPGDSETFICVIPYRVIRTGIETTFRARLEP